VEGLKFLFFENGDLSKETRKSREDPVHLSNLSVFRRVRSFVIYVNESSIYLR